MLIFGPKFLPDELIVASLETAMMTLSMETERLGFPALFLERRLRPTEAYYRGLLEGFVVGIMRAKGLANVNSGIDIVLSPKNRRVFDDAIEKACYHGSDFDIHAASFWTVCYAVSNIDLNRELFVGRLQSAMLLESAVYKIGKEDALYQSSIADTGMLQPTRKFELFLKDRDI